MKSTQAEIIETQPVETPPKKQAAEPPQPLHVTESGLIIAKTNGDIMRIIQQLSKGMAFPKTLDTPDKIIAAWQVAASLRIPPAVALQNMAVIHGSVSIWGQLPKALAEQTTQMAEYKLIYFDDNQNEICLGNKNLNAPVWGAVCQMRRLRRSKNEYPFTELDAKKAGLLSKSGPWQDYRRIMYARRVTGHACKFEFPDALMGVPVAEYDFHEAPDLKDVTPQKKNEDLQSARENIRRAKQQE